MDIEQSDLGYVQWKKYKCVELGLSNASSKISTVFRKRTDKKTGIVTSTASYRFTTLSKCWQFDSFYVYKSGGDPTYQEGEAPRRRKRFTRELLELFKDPLTLAVFYMDDGSVAGNSPYFATGECPLNEVEILQEVFLKNFGLNTNVRFSERLPVGITIIRADCDKFLDLVEDIVKEVPSMTYKLNITRYNS
jgi:hypothetical protein